MKVRVSTVALPLAGEPEAAEKMAQITDEAETVEVPDGSSVAELMDSVEVPFDQAEMALVNGRQEDFATILQDGDAVTFVGPGQGM